MNKFANFTLIFACLAFLIIGSAFTEELVEKVPGMLLDDHKIMISNSKTSKKERVLVK